MSEENDEKETLYIFGKDMSTVPCFRSTILNGVGTGIAVGLTYFMFTSKVRNAFLLGYSGMFASGLCYWFYCNYNFSKKRFELLRIQSLMEEKLLREGSVNDFNFDVVTESTKSSKT